VKDCEIMAEAEQGPSTSADKSLEDSPEGDVEKYTNVSGKIRLGRCKWFNVLKGFGFIVPEDGGQEVFVHQSVIKMGGFRSLAQDELVEFECKESGKGLEATRVSGPSETECQGSDFKPKPKKRFRKVRCYNCGEFANHLAKDCSHKSLPKRCHNCKNEDHLVADCPLKQEKPEKSEKSVGDSKNTATAEPN